MSQNVIEQPLPQPNQVSSPNGSGFAPSSIWVAISLGMGVLGFVARGIGKGRGITQAIAKLDAIWKTVEKLPDFEEEMGDKDRRLEETILAGQKSNQEQFSDMMRLFLDMQKGLGELNEKLENYQDEIEELQTALDEKHSDLVNSVNKLEYLAGQTSLLVERDVRPFLKLLWKQQMLINPNAFNRPEDFKKAAAAMGCQEDELKAFKQQCIALKQEKRKQKVEGIDKHLPAIPIDLDPPAAKQG